MHSDIFTGTMLSIMEFPERVWNLMQYLWQGVIMLILHLHPPKKFKILQTI